WERLATAKDYEVGGWCGSEARTLAKRLWVSDIAVNEGRELRLRERAHFLGLERAVLEQHQRGNAAHVIFRRRRGILVDVELGDLEATRVFGGDMVQGRRDHLAGSAPLGPVVHQDRGL